MFKLHISPSSLKRRQSHADSFGFIWIGIGLPNENLSLHFGLCGTTRMISVQKNAPEKFNSLGLLGSVAENSISCFVNLFKTKTTVKPCSVYFLYVAVCFSNLFYSCERRAILRRSSVRPSVSLPRPNMCCDANEALCLHATTPLFN